VAGRRVSRPVWPSARATDRRRRGLAHDLRGQRADRARRSRRWLADLAAHVQSRIPIWLRRARSVLLAGWLRPWRCRRRQFRGSGVILPLPGAGRAYRPSGPAGVVVREMRVDGPVVPAEPVPDTGVRGGGGGCRARQPGDVHDSPRDSSVPGGRTDTRAAQIGLTPGGSLGPDGAPLALGGASPGPVGAPPDGRRRERSCGGGAASTGVAGGSPVGWLLAVPLALAGCGLGAPRRPRSRRLRSRLCRRSEAGDGGAGVFSTTRYLGSIVGSAALAALLGGSQILGSAPLVFGMVELAALGTLACAWLMPRR